MRRLAQYLGRVAVERGPVGRSRARLADEPGAVGRRTALAAVGGADTNELVVIVVFVPETSADVVRDAAASAGAGALGEYRACSFSVTGSGRFEPIGSARPAIGVVGRPEVVAEQRIEVVCPRNLAGRALRAMLAVHPYEEPAHHVYRTIDPREL